MSEISRSFDDFVGYEYKEINTSADKASLYIDGYQSFGWRIDENIPSGKNGKIRLKRDRKILNRIELTRLQRNFDACVDEINTLEKSVSGTATIWALTIGLIGTAFMAGSTFSAVHEPPLVILCILLAIPGFICWILPYFVHKRIRAERAKRIRPLIEQKYDEIYELCEKGSGLLRG